MTVTTSTTAELTNTLKAEGQRLGFDAVGVCPAVPAPHIDALEGWLDAGYAGEMDYMPRRREAYQHPRHVLEGARSIVMVTYRYPHRQRTSSPQEGRISRYAAGRDYHEIMRAKLRQLGQTIERLSPGDRARAVVDTAPLLERDYAQMAGLGWIGKNTMLIHRKHGSWLFLGAVLTTAVLEYDEPFVAQHCGTCRACLDACPTGAIVKPFVLDARRCISYLTIEQPGPIDDALRPQLNGWLFGCDICQEVCPWNRKPDEPQRPEFVNGAPPILQLVKILDLDDTAFREHYQHTPLWRARRRGLLRSAALLLARRTDPEAICALKRSATDKDEVVREAAVWALGQHRPLDREFLQIRLAEETSPSVRDRLQALLEAPE